MDHAGRLGCRRAATDLPRARLVLAGRQERDQVERPVARMRSRVSRPGSATPNSSSSARASSGSISAVSASIDAYTPTASSRELGRAPSALLEVRDHDLGLQREWRDPAEDLRLVRAEPASRSGVSASSASFAWRSAATSSFGLALGALLAPSRARSRSPRGRPAAARRGPARARSPASRPARSTGPRRPARRPRAASRPLRARDPAGHVDEPHLGGDRLLRAFHLGEDLRAAGRGRARPRRWPDRRASRCGSAP